MFGAFNLWIYLMRCCHGAWRFAGNSKKNKKTKQTKQKKKHMPPSFDTIRQGFFKGISCKIIGSFGLNGAKVILVMAGLLPNE